MGPWVPSLAVFPLTCRVWHCTHVSEALFPRVPGHFVRKPFLTHHVVLNLGFTLIILHVVLEYFHLGWCCASFTLFSGTFTPPGAVSPQAFVLSPCSFTLLHRQGCGACGHRQRASGSIRTVQGQLQSPLAKLSITGSRSTMPEQNPNSRTLRARAGSTAGEWKGRITCRLCRGGMRRRRGNTILNIF